jgi:hypothetical protein
MICPQIARFRRLALPPVGRAILPLYLAHGFAVECTREACFLSFLRKQESRNKKAARWFSIIGTKELAKSRMGKSCLYYDSDIHICESRLGILVINPIGIFVSKINFYLFIT